MPRNYIGGLKGVTPLAGDPVDLRTSGVFNLGSLGGDVTASGDADFGSVTLLLDGSGTTDLSSASSTVTPSGSNTYTTGNTSGAKFGQYIDFQDTGYFNVALPSALGVSGDPFTVETWVYFDVDGNDGVFQLYRPGDTLDSTPVDGTQSLAVARKNGVWTVYNELGTVNNIASAALSTWHHVALVYDGTDLVFYVNGTALLTESNWTTNLNTATGYPNIGIGGYYDTTALLDGYIEDFRVTKGVARYTSSFTPPTSDLTNTVPSGTVELRMDGTDGAGSGSTTTDLSSFSHTGITSTDVTAGTTDSGVTRPDLYGGTKGYLDFTSSQAGRIVTLPTTVDLSSGDFTIECWVLFDTISQFRSFMRGGTGSASGTWQLQTYDSKISLLTGGASTYTITDSKTVTTNTWYHVALSYVSSTYTMTLSVDGNCTSLTNQTEFSNMQSSYLGGSGTNIQLGANRGGTVRHDGLLTDVRFTTGAALYPDLGRITPIPTAALPTTGTVAGATRPTRKWGGLVGRSLIASDALVKTGNLKLSELLQATYGESISYGAGTGGNNSYQATIDGQLYQFREFTSNGTFNVTTAGTFDVLLVGGGGEAGGRISGGGGGGAVMLTSTTHNGSGVTLATGNHTITVGAGGTGGGNSAAGNNGGSTTAFNITATGGGGGGSYFQSAQTLGRDGANGGGAGAFATGTYSGGSGTAPTFPAGITGNVYAGYNGGSSQWASNISTGGGGGAAANGTDAASATAGNGGDGIQITNFEQTDYYYGGGGAGVYYSTTMGTGGKGGGAGSGDTNGRNTAGNGSGTNGAANTGGGGAGTLTNVDTDTGGAGGSGIVVIRYAI